MKPWVLIIHLISTRVSALSNADRVCTACVCFLPFTITIRAQPCESHVQCLTAIKFDKSTHTHTHSEKTWRTSCDDRDSNGNDTLTGTDKMKANTSEVYTDIQTHTLFMGAWVCLHVCFVCSFHNSRPYSHSALFTYACKHLYVKGCASWDNDNLFK